MKFSNKNFFKKYEPISSFLQIRSHLLMKFLLKNFIFVLWILIKTLSRKSPRSADLQDCTFSYRSFRSRPPEVFLEKGVLKIWHGFSPVNLLHNLRAPFNKNTSRGLLLKLKISKTEAFAPYIVTTVQVFFVEGIMYFRRFILNIIIYLLIRSATQSPWKVGLLLYFTICVCFIKYVIQFSCSK